MAHSPKNSTSKTLRCAIYAAALTDAERADEKAAIEKQITQCREEINYINDNRGHLVHYDEVCVAVENVDAAMRTGRRRVFESLVCAYALGEIDAIYAVDQYHMAPAYGREELIPLKKMGAHIQFASSPWIDYSPEWEEHFGRSAMAFQNLQNNMSQALDSYENRDSAFETTYDNVTPRHICESDMWWTIRSTTVLDKVATTEQICSHTYEDLIRPAR